MSSAATCPHCGASCESLQDVSSDRWVRCPGCGESILVRAAGAEGNSSTGSQAPDSDPLPDPNADPFPDPDADPFPVPESDPLPVPDPPPSPDPDSASDSTEDSSDAGAREAEPSLILLRRIRRVLSRFKRAAKPFNKLDDVER